ncbi:MAG: methyltransferase domain-containing protein [Candidatus Methanoperedens sp.]|nr:methyltransferase domain-containing protein [Candidatus Methanoperedens sp.]
MKQLESNDYFGRSYDTKERFIGYWHQINEVVGLNPTKVLEIGIGSGFISKYLKERKINVITLDIKKELKPDVCGSILTLPFANNSFDVVACYEVLEHLPYENFPKAISEIFRVSKSYTILSIPDANKFCRLFVQIPKIVSFKKIIPLTRLKNPVHKLDYEEEHYWEIGKAGYPLSKIIKDIKMAGFKVEKTYRIFEHPYHRFFKLDNSKDVSKI